MSRADERRLAQVGLDRLLRVAWLEKTASLSIAGNEPNEIKAALQEDLRSSFVSSNVTVRGSLDKTITILMKVWVNPPAQLKLLCTDGLDLFRLLPRNEHVAVHWGMVAAVYPFWASVATQAGRLLRLQESVSAAHVQRRIREEYGERETVSRRARYVLRSFIDWGVLRETDVKGLYKVGSALAIDDPRLASWLIEAMLHSRPRGVGPLVELTTSPSIFPFHLEPIGAEKLLAASANLEVLRHSLNEDLVMLRSRSEASN